VTSCWKREVSEKRRFKGEGGHTCEVEVEVEVSVHVSCEVFEVSVKEASV